MTNILILLILFASHLAAAGLGWWLKGKYGSKIGQVVTDVKAIPKT